MNEAVVPVVRLRAQIFRKALESLPSPHLPGLRNFPRGACGDTSRLLAQYFRDIEMGEWSITTGWRNSRQQSHAWLESDGWIVDVTADQFMEVHEPVLVLFQPRWHASWEMTTSSNHDVGLSYYSDSSGAREDYERLCALAAGFHRPE